MKEIFLNIDTSMKHLKKLFMFIFFSTRDIGLFYYKRRKEA